MGFFDDCMAHPHARFSAAIRERPSAASVQPPFTKHPLRNIAAPRIIGHQIIPRPANAGSGDRVPALRSSGRLPKMAWEPFLIRAMRSNPLGVEQGDQLPGISHRWAAWRWTNKAAANTES